MSLDSVLHSLRPQYAQYPVVHRHVSSLLKSHRCLLPSKSTFHHPDGSNEMLLQLSGTVPIFFRGAQYNIPVDIFLPGGYPQKGPKVYVRPTNGMVLKGNHRHVDREGLVYMVSGMSQ